MITRRSFIMLTGVALNAARAIQDEVPSMLDHVLLGCSDLERGIEFVERHLGVRAAFGGVHPGRGTQNALLSLGERRYLEIIAPDPRQRGVLRHADIVSLHEPRLLGWAAHVSDMDGLSSRLRKAGVAFQGPQPGSRQRPDGRVLKWRTLVLADDRRGLLPFFIQWDADSPHPSSDAPKGCSLARLEAAAPDSEELGKLSALLGLDLLITEGEEPQLRATFYGTGGRLSITN
jgi:catechol 2,3-dioxygenase-like lactoylglutathione lyase family enzyme